MKANRLFVALSVCMLCAVCSLTGCQNQEQPVNPYITPGTTENPNWVITVENDMSASMTSIAKVSFTEKQGTLAAFMGNDCCGVAEYIDGLYWLYITPATEAGGEVQLKFYSPDLKRIFVAKETFTFRNDAQLGSVSEPYTPEWKVAE